MRLTLHALAYNSSHVLLSFCSAASGNLPMQAHGSPITSSSVCNSAIPNPDVYGRFLSVVRNTLSDVKDPRTTGFTRG